ncbi:MAG: hypothetical protein LBM95_08655 [Lactobacillales bacterium]|jgi:hypothetical protein|nr:hypothetical protein [Lactobacillales bacterium]
MKKKRMFLIVLIGVTVIAGIFYVGMKPKNNTKKTGNSSTISSSTSVRLSTTTAPTSTSTTTTESRVPIPEVKEARKMITEAGYDSTVYSDEEAVSILQKAQEENLSVKEYLEKNHKAEPNEEEMEKARKDLQKAGIDVDKMTAYDISELIKEAKKQEKTVVEVAKNNK